MREREREQVLESRQIPFPRSGSCRVPRARLFPSWVPQLLERQNHLQHLVSWIWQRAIVVDSASAIGGGVLKPFNDRHGLKEHQPLGSANRSQFRNHFRVVHTKE